MKRLILLFTILIAIKANCQLLTATRARHIKECTVRINIQGTTITGTGFLVGTDGTIATCYHVVNPSLVFDAANHVNGESNLLVQFENGEVVVYGLPTYFGNDIDTLKKYDMCWIVPVHPLNHQTPNIKLGNFNNVNDGDEIITCGYPFGISQSFLSRGMVASKTKVSPTGVPINGALLDVTMNRGNSGGVIYKIGDNEAQDEAIGIADFIITPIGKDVTELLDSLKKTSKTDYITIGGINPNASMEKIIETLSNTSDGVSGCISIEYLQNLVAIAKRNAH